MKLIIESARQGLRLVGPERRWKWPLLAVLALAVTALEALGAALIYALISLVSTGGETAELPLAGDLTTRFPELSLQTLQVAVAIAVAVFFVLRAGVLIGQSYIQARVVHNAGARIANELVRGYLAMPYLFHTQRNSSELVRNAFDTAQRFVSKVIMPLVTLMAEGLLVLGLATVLLVISPVATVLAIVGLGSCVWLLLRIVQPRLKQLGRRSQSARQGSLQALQQALDGFRDIRLLGREDTFAKAFKRERLQLARSEYVKTALGELPRALIETALVLVIVTVFMVAVLAGEGVEGVLSTLGVFAYVGLRLQPALQKVVRSLNDLRFGEAALEDLTFDQTRIAEAREAERRRHQVDDPSEFTDSIELRGVSLTYAAEAVPAVSDIELQIRRGEFVGICGPTGGGKSTLVDLIVGLLEPTEGQVLVDGKDLRGREVWWQAQLGVVSQSIFLIDDTLKHNIAFGRQDEDIEETALLRAASNAQLDDVVASLPDGMETPVGERGIRLSGGQRQRVAIARALYREPSVIVFDEGTSALDTATESALVAALSTLREDRTLITVAHRISTVRDADRILVVEGGRLVAQGTYEDLLDRNALFRSLVR